MKKMLYIMLLGVLSVSIVGCEEKEQNTGKKNTQDIAVETNISDEAFDEQVYDTEEDTITPQMQDREIDSSVQIGNTVLEMPITYTDIENVPDIEMYTDEDRTVPATDTYLIEANSSQEIFGSIYGTNFKIWMRNISESDLSLTECIITDIMDIDGPSIVLPGNVQVGKTDLRTLKSIFGDEIMHSDDGYWHTYAGKTCPYIDLSGEGALFPITGNMYNFNIDEVTQVVNNIWWEVNDCTQTEQVIKTKCFDNAYPDISITIEDGWNPCCLDPNDLIYELFKTSAGNEYVFMFDQERTYTACEIGRNDIDSSRCVKYESGTEFDYTIRKINENDFALDLYNDTTNFTCYFVTVMHVSENSEIITDINDPSDIDEIANHLMELLKTAQMSAK